MSAVGSALLTWLGGGSALAVLAKVLPSLLGGVPGLPSLLVRFMPVRGPIPRYDRSWIALVLTSQVAVGAALGIGAQILLVVVILGYVMPFFGLELFDMARDVAAFNLPARVGQLFGVSL